VRKSKADASVLLLGAIVLLLGAGIAFTVVSLRSDPIEEALSGDQVVNTLFVIEHQGKPLGSYVLNYYPATKRAAVFDIPGELGLIIQRIKRVDRIDSVYDPQRIAPFENEIEGLLGIPINFSLVLETENLGKIVDLIEGVELFIPSPVEIYQEGGPILLPSGITRLDGDKAKLYLTYEIPEESGELAHFRRQRFFLGFIKRLGERNEALKNPQAARLYQSLIKTGISRRVRVRLFDELSGIDTDRVRSVNSVGGTSREVSGQTLILPDYNGETIKEIVRRTLRDIVNPAEGSDSERIFTVQVLNGTSTNGLAGKTAELLQGFGYDVISIGNADNSGYENTVVIDHFGYEDKVQDFASIIRCDNILFEAVSLENPELDMNLRNYDYQSDFTLIIGRDFDGRYVSGR
jgi:anionic cell wall polymer biosynthesis LytR-Cps2A-Psr (LCP) family protein